MQQSLLAQLRRTAGLSQEELADAAGISVRSIRDIERGVVARPRRDSVRRLARALQLTDAARTDFEQHYRGPATFTAYRRDTWSLTPEAGRPSVPAELPPDIADFVGRGEELKRVVSALAPGRESQAVRSVVVVGAGGLGKSILAVHAAHRVQDDYPDGQLFVNLAGQRHDRPTTEQLLAELLGSLGVHPAALPGTTQARAKLFRTLTADRRLLVVFDDAATSAQLRDLLPGGSQNGILVTSRGPLYDLGATEIIRLGPVPAADAVELLARLSGRHAESDLMVFGRLAELCGYLPLALRIVGARLAARPDWTVEHCLERLSDEHNRLRELTHGSLDVAASLQISYHALLDGIDPADDVAAHAFPRLARIPGSGFSLQTAAAVLDRPADLVDAALGRLLEVGLLETSREGRFGYHNLTRLFALSLMEPAPRESSRLLNRLGDYYLDQFGAAIKHRIIASGMPEADETLAADDDDPAGERDRLLEWLHREYPNCCAYIVAALRTEHPDLGRVLRLLQRVNVVGQGVRDVETRKALVQALLDTAQHEPGAGWYAAWAHGDLAYTAVLEGNLKAARDHLLAARANPARDHRIHADCEFANSLVLRHEGKYAAAAAGFRRTIRIAGPLARRQRRHALGNLSISLLHDGQPLEALKYRLRSVELARQHGMLDTVAFELSLLSVVLTRLGCTDRAVAAARKALEAARRLKFLVLEAQAELSLGLAMQQAGDRDGAWEAFRRSLELATTSGDPRAQATSHLELGKAAQAAGDTVTARQHAERARSLYHIGEPGRAHEATELLASLVP